VFFSVRNLYFSFRFSHFRPSLVKIDAKPRAFCVACRGCLSHKNFYFKYKSINNKWQRPLIYSILYTAIWTLPHSNPLIFSQFCLQLAISNLYFSSHVGGRVVVIVVAIVVVGLEHGHLFKHPWLMSTHSVLQSWSNIPHLLQQVQKVFLQDGHVHKLESIRVFVNYSRNVLLSQPRNSEI